MKDAAFFVGLRPELADLARIHRDRCANVGLPVVFTSGFRAPATQMALYEEGRAWQRGIGWHVVDPHLVVTNAIPEHAPHCRGAAYDVAPIDQHEQIDWKRIDLFEAVARLAPPGLVWGGSWRRLKDLPHYELVGWRNLPMPATPAAG